MSHLDDILVFVKIAQFESISKAARSLGMPISTVSRKLSVLESTLGVSLVRRTTRRVTLTPQGKEYFDRCAEPLNILEQAEQALTQAQKSPEGTLRLSVPMYLAQGPFMDFLSKFSKAHASIRLELYVTNLYVNLIADNIDLAVRIGGQSDSSAVATRVGKIVRLVVAAPEYMKGRKLPQEPEDLKSHDCVMFNGTNSESNWELMSGRRRVRVHVSGSVSSRDCSSAAGFVLRGHGIGLLETAYCDEPLSRGELVRLLPRWASPPIPVLAVYPSRKFLPSRVKAFLDAFVNWNSPLWMAG